MTPIFFHKVMALTFAPHRKACQEPLSRSHTCVMHHGEVKPQHGPAAELGRSPVLANPLKSGAAENSENSKRYGSKAKHFTMWLKALAPLVGLKKKGRGRLIHEFMEQRSPEIKPSIMVNMDAANPGNDHHRMKIKTPSVGSPQKPYEPA